MAFFWISSKYHQVIEFQMKRKTELSKAFEDEFVHLDKVLYILHYSLDTSHHNP